MTDLTYKRHIICIRYVFVISKSVKCSKFRGAVLNWVTYSEGAFKETLKSAILFKIHDKLFWEY